MTPEFWDPGYWRERYLSARDLFDWYVQVPEVLPALEGVLTPDSRILDVGAGTSRAVFQLYDLGYHRVAALDQSPEAKAAVAGELDGREGITYAVGSVCALPFPDSRFDIVLDKGTLDCLLACPKDPMGLFEAGVTEIARVLADGGTLVSVTFDGESRDELMDYCGRGCGLRVVDSRRVHPPPLGAKDRPPTCWVYVARKCAGAGADAEAG